MDKILLIGGGGHCKSVIDVIEQENRFQVSGIIERPELSDRSILGCKVIGCDDDLPELARSFKYVLITVGQIKSPDLRIKLFEKAKFAGFILPIIVSPRAYVSRFSDIDEGTVVMHDSIVNADAKIGRNCIINTGALIEHDSVIGDDCHISTGAIINGGVKVERGCFIGSNATTKEYAVIKENSFVKAGEVVK